MLRCYVITPDTGDPVEYTAYLRPDKNFEVGARAYDGQADQGNVTFDDPDGELDWLVELAAGRIIYFTEDDSGAELVIASGRIAPKAVERGTFAADKGREFAITIEDRNADLRNTIVHGWERPREPGRTRALALLEGYLSGAASTELNPNGDIWGRDSTDIAPTYVPDLQNQWMPAKTYEATDPQSVLRECAEYEGKRFFVYTETDGTLALYYAPVTETAQLNSTISVSTVIADVDFATCFEPIWNAGPAFSSDGLETVSGALLIHTDGSTTYERRDALNVVTGALDIEERHDRREQSVYTDGDPADGVDELHAYLNARDQEERRRQFSLDIPSDSIHLVKAGMRMEVKLAWAGLIPAPEFFRIGQTRIRWIAPSADGDNHYQVIVTLEYPVKLLHRWPTGVKPGPQPPGEGGPASCSLNPGDMTAIFTPNGDFETGTGANWTGANVQPAASGASGDWMSHDVGIGPGGWTYDGWTGLTFTAGQTYVIRVPLMSGNGGGATLQFGDFVSDGVGTDYAAATGGGGGLTLDAAVFIENCLEWTPSADRTGVRMSFSRSASGTIGTDDLQAYTGSSPDVPPAADDDVGSIGTPGCYATCDHKHPVSLHADLLGLTADDHLYVRDRAGGEEAISVIAATGATETIDLAGANVHDLTLTANCTFTLSAVTSGVACSASLLLRQDGTGSRTVTWPGSVVWPGGVAPTLSTAAGAVDIISLVTLNGGTTWYGSYAGAAGGSGAPTTADYLVGTANAGLSAEIVVGTTPGGELGNTWASPTVDATHSGSAHADFIAKAIVDAKGDIIAATAADTVARLAVGSNGLVLTADSAESTGLKWAAAGAGGGAMTHTYYGRTSTGGSWLTMPRQRWYMRKITLASAGLLTSIAGHLKMASPDTATLGVALFSDAAGVADLLIAQDKGKVDLNYGDMVIGTTGRWIDFPLSKYLAAGDYWLGIACLKNENDVFSIAYDATGGAASYFDNATVQDPASDTITTTAFDLSLRASVIS